MNRHPSGDHPRRDPNRHPHHRQHAPGAAPDEPPVVVKVTNPSDLVTAVSYLLGYQPPDTSLVVIGVHGRRLVMAARTDLPDLAELPTADALAGAWAMFDRPLANSDADAVAVIAYTDPTWDNLLRGFADAAPLPVRDLLRVHAGRCWTLSCPHPDRCDHPGCAPDGAPITDDLAITAPLIANGAAAPGTRDDLSASLQPGPDEVIQEVVARLQHQPDRSSQDLYRALCEAHDARTGGPDPIPPGQAAVLLTALADVHVRDTCLAWTDDAAWWLWHDLIRVAPPGHVAPVATVIAVLAYQRGDGVLAAIATDHALADRPGYGLARLVQASLHHAIPPEAITTLITEALATHPLTPAPGPDGAEQPPPDDETDTPDPIPPSDTDHHDE